MNPFGHPGLERFTIAFIGVLGEQPLLALGLIAPAWVAMPLYISIAVISPGL